MNDWVNKKQEMNDILDSEKINENAKNFDEYSMRFNGARGKLLDLDSLKEQDSKNEKKETEYRED